MASDEEMWELEEEEYYPQIHKNSKDVDKRFGWFLLFPPLLASNTIINSLSSSEIAALEGYVESSGMIRTVGSAATRMASNLPFITESTVMESCYLNPLEFQRYSQILAETQQYGRMIDPKTVENIAFRQQQQTLDQVGMFGGVESEKGGVLSVYYGETVLIPWETQGDDSVCDDCLILEAGGPYSPNNFPEPPHYGCRCNDPMPDPIVVERMDLD